MNNSQTNENNLGSLGGIGRALSSPNFVLYCFGLGLNLTGIFVFFVALGWVAWELTNSVSWVGTIVLAETLPGVVISPLAGVIIDRTSAKRALFWAQLVSAVVMAVLTVVTFADLITIELLMVFAILNGSLSGIAFPAHFAIMPKLVPREDLSAAIAFQSSVSQAARFIGPALAGVLIVWAGGGMAFAYNTLSYSAFLVALVLIDIDESQEIKPASPGIADDLIAGFKYAWSNIHIRLLLVVAVCVAFQYILFGLPQRDGIGFAGLGISNKNSRLVARLAFRVFDGDLVVLDGLFKLIGFHIEMHQPCVHCSPAFATVENLGWVAYVQSP